MMTTMTTTQQEQALAYALALWRVPGVGPKHFHRLQSKFPDLQDLFKEKPEQLVLLGCPTKIVNGLSKPDWPGVEKDMQFHQQSDQAIIELQHAYYPGLLKEINDPPPFLFVRGDLTVLKHQQIAMVGSRQPTVGGQDLAHHFAKSLCHAGLCVTSGLAMGVDGLSHKAALNAKGKTIAVMATGLDTIYPSRHTALAKQIVTNGALVSEFPIGVKPLASHFPRRNRIISGLSLGVLVVEAAIRSGSLITARYASEQGREVFAIPGSIHNPLARGCHYLIRQGAKLVETIDDILEEVASLSSINFEQKNMNCDKLTLGSKQQLLVECMGYDIVDADLLVIRTGLTINEIGAMLSLLEIEGIIKAVPGGYTRVQA